MHLSREDGLSTLSEFPWHSRARDRSADVEVSVAAKTTLSPNIMRRGYCSSVLNGISQGGALAGGSAMPWKEQDCNSM